jgi:undecaprenyl-diphosphatase
MKLVTFIGRLYSVLPLAAGVIVVLWRTGLKREAWVLAFVMAGEVPIEQVLKWAIHRPRPSPFFSYALPSSYSFPSGHALASVLLFGTLAALLAPHIRGKSNKLLLWLAAALMIAAIGFSRVYLGVHYPTDVIAGYAAGLAWVLTVWSVRSSGAGILSNAPHDS